MILPDVNVLIYAFRKDVPQHALCRRWLDNIILGDERFALSKLAMSSVVRISTNSRIYSEATTLADAFGFCEDLLGQPHCTVLEPGPRHWEIFKRFCLDADIRGPKVSDAYFAALAIEWDCEWITLDRDFARFKGLKWRAPGDGNV